MESFKDAPATIQELYKQFKAKNPVAALNLTGFVALNKRNGAEQIYTYYIQNQEELNAARQSCRNFEFIAPFFDKWRKWENKSLSDMRELIGWDFAGSSLFSAIAANDHNLVKCLLDMGFDPREEYVAEGTNALHFAVWKSNFLLVQRLVTEHKMSLVDKDRQGRGSFSDYRDHNTDLMKWVSEQPNIDEIIKANQDSAKFLKDIQLFLKKKPIQESIQIAMSLVKEKSSKDWFSYLLTVVDDKDAFQSSIKTAKAYSQDKLIQEWILGFGF